MAGGVVIDAAGAAGTGIGGGVGVWSTWRFVRWACEFYYSRRDVREARLTARERQLEARYDTRLAHVEDELRKTRQALMVIINDVATNDAANPVLQRVAAILGTDDPNINGPLDKMPISEPSPSMAELIQRADRAAPNFHWKGDK